MSNGARFVLLVLDNGTTGMTGMQLAIVIVLALAFLCIVAGFAYYFLAMA